MAKWFNSASLSNDNKGKYKAAIIGCGKIAGGYDRFAEEKWTATHAGAYRLSEKAELVAAADIDSSALSEFGNRWKIYDLYGDYRKMLVKECPDLVSVCVPVEEHFDCVKSACEAGVRAIFLEKPVAESLNEAYQMRTLVGDRPIAVNYFRRWNPTLRDLKEELDEKKWGRTIRVTVHYVKGVHENASHFLDLLRWFFGDPEGVRLLRVFDEVGRQNGADFEVEYPGGVLATFLHLPAPGYVFHEVDIFTERARVVIGQRGQSLGRFCAVDEPHYQMFQIIPMEGEVIETKWRNCTFRAVDELIQCLEEGGVPTCGLEDGIHSLEICEKILSEKPSGVWPSV